MKKKLHEWKALHGVGLEMHSASFMMGPNRSHVFNTPSVSTLQVCFTDV